MSTPKSPIFTARKNFNFDMLRKHVEAYAQTPSLDHIDIEPAFLQFPQFINMFHAKIFYDSLLRDKEYLSIESEARDKGIRIITNLESCQIKISLQKM